MSKNIDYLKSQAQKLFKDYKTQGWYQDVPDGSIYFMYSPVYFDIERIFFDYKLDNEHQKNFTLMKAQHLISQILGFKKWTDLINASTAEIELARLLWDNQHKIHLENWKMYVAQIEAENNTTLDAESRLAIFKRVFADVNGHQSQFGDYRLKKH